MCNHPCLVVVLVKFHFPVIDRLLWINVDLAMTFCVFQIGNCFVRMKSKEKGKSIGGKLRFAKCFHRKVMSYVGRGIEKEDSVENTEFSWKIYDSEI